LTKSKTQSAIQSGYAKFYSRSHDAVINVYVAAGNVIETHEHKAISRQLEDILKFASDYSMANNDPKQILEDLLLRAEARYGKQAHQVEFTVQEKEEGSIAVEFHNDALTNATVHIQANLNENQQRFQLALEGFHLLSPVPRHEVTYLEEGLSQIFALNETVGLLPENDIHYQKAHRLCASLEQKCGSDIVRRLREHQAYISRITPAQIIDLCGTFPNGDAQSLCERWPYYQ